MAKLHEPMTFSVRHFAQFEQAEITFGDLTVLVGPQATGKSLLLQLFKLAQDAGTIQRELKRLGSALQTPEQWAEAYFGEGFGQVWSEVTRWQWQNEEKGPTDLLPPLRERSEKVFYIPAQRALIFHQASWPQAFTHFRGQDPYLVRSFSEQMRLLLERGLGGQVGVLFPRKRRLSRALRAQLETQIFRGTTLKVIIERGQKRLMLELESGERLPYLSWSAGQREFIPLLLGIYWLLPLGRTNKRTGVQWVVIEEPEMGLHPAAQEGVLLLIAELMHRGYRVVLSTHSPTVLDMVWALRFIYKTPREKATEKLRQLFNLPASSHNRQLMNSLLDKTFKVYFFAPTPTGTSLKDISTLDAFAEDEAVADWGGLTSFASRAEEIVAEAVNEEEGTYHVQG